MIEAVAAAAGVPAEPARRGLMLSGDLTRTAEVALTAGEWGVILSAEEARLLGEALMDAADDAESGVE